MTTKKVLFAGCSLTADSGFNKSNQLLYHWPNLFCQEFNYSMTNIAIGGMSNQEIFLRTTEELTNNTYDLVIVMWSEINRCWGYYSYDNIDDFTILNKGIPKGFNAADSQVQDYAKLHFTIFNNNYINIKNWLLYCFSLEQTLKNSNTPFIFIRGFDNHINDLSKAEYNNGFTNFDSIRYMFDFDNRPDDYILYKLNTLKNLISNQDQRHWLNFDSVPFVNKLNDKSDDNAHPGKLSNKALADTLFDFYRKLYV
jgi:hypothetical protein